MDTHYLPYMFEFDQISALIAEEDVIDILIIHGEVQLEPN